MRLLPLNSLGSPLIKGCALEGWVIVTKPDFWGRWWRVVDVGKCCIIMIKFKWSGLSKTSPPIPSSNTLAPKSTLSWLKDSLMRTTPSTNHTYWILSFQSSSIKSRKSLTLNPRARGRRTHRKRYNTGYKTKNLAISTRSFIKSITIWLIFW